MIKVTYKLVEVDNEIKIKIGNHYYNPTPQMVGMQEDLKKFTDKELEMALKEMNCEISILFIKHEIKRRKLLD